MTTRLQRCFISISRIIFLIYFFKERLGLRDWPRTHKRVAPKSALPASKKRGSDGGGRKGALEVKLRRKLGHQREGTWIRTR